MRGPLSRLPLHKRGHDQGKDDTRWRIIPEGGGKRTGRSLVASGSQKGECMRVVRILTVVAALTAALAIIPVAEADPEVFQSNEQFRCR